MSEIIKTQKYLLIKRAKIIKFLKQENYSSSDIARIFNIDKSAISRILATEKNYKDVARNLLKD